MTTSPTSVKTQGFDRLSPWAQAGVRVRPGTVAVDGAGGNRHARHLASPGFTLIEILLALAVFVLLAGVLVVNYSGWLERRAFNDAAQRFETALRMARADAATTGRSLRLTFDESGAAQVLWEPDPLEEPGVFVPYERSTWTQYLPRDTLVVESSTLVGPSAFRTLLLDGEPINVGSGEAVVDPVTFLPDGSMDDAVIVLRSRSENESRRVVVQTYSVAGTVRMQLMSELQWEAYNEAADDDMAMR